MVGHLEYVGAEGTRIKSHREELWIMIMTDVSLFSLGEMMIRVHADAVGKQSIISHDCIGDCFVLLMQRY